MDAHITTTARASIQNQWIFWRPIYRYTWALWQRSSYQHFAAYLNTLENATILDLGTGTGAYIPLLALKKNTHIIFTDPDPLALAQAQAIPSPCAQHFTFDVLDAEHALAKYSNVTHLSLVHVYSVLDEPCDFLGLCHRKAPQAVMLIYLSKFNGLRWLDFLSSRLGFKQIDRSVLQARFSYESVSRLNAVYSGPP